MAIPIKHLIAMLQAQGLIANDISNHFFPSDSIPATVDQLLQILESHGVLTDCSIKEIRRRASLSRLDEDIVPIAALCEMKPERRNPILKDAVLEAANRLLIKDMALFAIGVHEQAICHRLAVHLENVWGSVYPLSIDCEYNRNIGETKKFPKNTTNVGKAFRPDIIFHERTNNPYNLLAIETKSDACSNKADSDKKKIEDIVKGFQYDLGAFLQFGNRRGTKMPSVTVEFCEGKKWTSQAILYETFSENLAHLAAYRDDTEIN